MLASGAHPRVGGENLGTRVKKELTVGSSPRGRGKQMELGAVGDMPGLIPAWAGKTWAFTPTTRRDRAHPRVGGENSGAIRHRDAIGGSSPRGRGKLVDGVDRYGAAGLIPAWAGKTVRRYTAPSGSAAHPRVGGENVRTGSRRSRRSGSSPRGRGKRSRRDVERGDRGLIPAWAGKTRSTSGRATSSRAHPRVGGENFSRRVFRPPCGGSSPRGRGKRKRLSIGMRSTRLIPAWAGKTRGRAGRCRPCTAHPRVGGENSAAPVSAATKAGSSPRGRGKPGLRGGVREALGLIPAWAGKTH